MKKTRSTKPATRRVRVTRRSTKSAPRRRARVVRGNALPPGVDPELLKTMSLHVATRGDDAPSLTSKEIERALISGEHARTLETYFGEQEYAELTALAARAARRSVRGGTRVLILPGILGSTLARMKGDRADTIWVDFWDILRGRLDELVLPDTGKSIRPIDAHPGTYLKLKLWLRGEGFDADEHAFDWRQTIPDLGAALKKRIDDEGRDVYLVAHSMGGLVARAALGHGLNSRLKRLIMLGTPNYGSFAPVMVFRGIYRFLKIISLLDFAHSPKELAGKTFNTFPGLTEMMPQREKFSSVDLYDPRAWPKKGPRPLEALLKSAPKAQARLAKPPVDRATMIAGVEQKTTTGLRVNGDEFVFEQSNNGDGTVPLDFALLPGIDTWFIREGHGELPKNKKVWQAVKELIRGETVTQLDHEWSPSRSGVTLMTETEFEATQEPAGVRGGEVRPAELRNFMEEFAAGPKPTLAVPAPGAIAVVATETPFQSVIIGRRRQRRVEIRLAHGSLTQVKTRAYVLGLFQDVAPGGAALAVDAAMNGTITEFTQRRMFSNAVGELFMLPAGRNELRADQVIFTGLGAFDRFNLQTLETVAENLARTLVRTDIEEFATILMGAGTGLPLDPAVRAYILGFLRGLTDSDPDHHFRGITLCELNEARYDAVKWALYRLSSTPLFDDVEVTLTEISLPPPPLTISATTRGGAVGTTPTIYLNVRSEQLKGALRLCSSVLTSGAKATVIGGEQEVANKVLDAQLAKIEGEGFGYASLPNFGAELAGLVLPSDVIAALEGSAGQHLVVVHDADASRIPWETLQVGKRAPALDGGVSRRYIAANMSVAKWLEQRRQSPTLNMLLVVNPTGDLPGAETEGGRIEKICQQQPRVRLTKLLRGEATRAKLLEEFRSGEYDVLHYAGHAFFDRVHPPRSGLLCAGHEVLTGADLAGLAKLPSLVFFNACESARVRKLVKKTPNTTRDLEERIARSVSLAEAFLRGGVANYLGTYWPVGDAPAEAFARIFYTALLGGESIGHAVQKARKEVDTLKSPDWADYLQYGSFEFSLKQT